MKRTNVPVIALICACFGSCIFNIRPQPTACEICKGNVSTGGNIHQTCAETLYQESLPRLDLNGEGGLRSTIGKDTAFFNSLENTDFLRWARERNLSQTDFENLVWNRLENCPQKAVPKPLSNASDFERYLHKKRILNLVTYRGCVEWFEQPNWFERLILPLSLFSMAFALHKLTLPLEQLSTKAWLSPLIKITCTSTLNLAIKPLLHKLFLSYAYRSESIARVMYDDAHTAALLVGCLYGLFRIGSSLIPQALELLHC